MEQDSEDSERDAGGMEATINCLTCPGGAQPRFAGRRTHRTGGILLDSFVNRWLFAARRYTKIVHKLARPTNLAVFRARIESLHTRTRLKPECFAVSYHKTETEKIGHFHFVHLCPWTYRSCHCFDDFEFVERSIRTTSTESYGVINALRQLYYLTKDGRRIVYAKIGQDSWRKVYRAEPIQSVRCAKCSATTTLVKSNYQNEVGVSRKRQNDEEDRTPGKRPRRDDGETSRRNHRVTSNEIVSFIKAHMVVPVENIYLHNEWSKNRLYSFILPGDKVYVRAIQDVKTWLRNISTEDLVSHYASIERPIFEQVNVADDHYFHPEVSAFLAYELLEYQMDVFVESGDYSTVEVGVVDFMQNLTDVIDKLIPKKNTFQIISEPSAGKNFFLDPILLFYGNVGRIGNFNRNNQFPLQECPNRRILYWNEPNFEPSKLDELKMLLGGDTIPCKVKHQGDSYVYKTPVLITTNNKVFPNTEAFNHRMYTWTWERASYLKQYNKKLHPLMWPILLEKFKIHKLSPFGNKTPFYSVEEREAFGTVFEVLSVT